MSTTIDNSESWDAKLATRIFSCIWTWGCYGQVQGVAQGQRDLHGGVAQIHDARLGAEEQARERFSSGRLNLHRLHHCRHRRCHCRRHRRHRIHHLHRVRHRLRHRRHHRHLH